jgi:hypothetical protein
MRNPVSYTQHCVHNVSDDRINTSTAVVSRAGSWGQHIYCQPNTALFSFIFCFATFFLAYLMREIRHSSVFGSRTRQIVSGFGIFTAIAALALVSFVARHNVCVQTLHMAGPYSPPDSTFRRDWVAHPMGGEKPLPIGSIFSAIIPTLLTSLIPN